MTDIEKTADLSEKRDVTYSATDLTPYLASYAKDAAPRKISDRTRFWLWFNVYRRYFTFIVLLNWIGIALAASDNFAFGYQKAVWIATFNIFMAVAMRSELLLRGLYWLVVKLFAIWPPLSMRIGITSCVQQLGGVHSGCAVAGVSWLLMQVVLVFLDPNQPASVRTLALLTLIALVISTASSIPPFRERHHNWFESFHRYAGWSAVITLWVFIFVSAVYESNDPVKGGDNWVSDTTKNATLWLTVLITMLIGAAWSTLRKVPIECRLQPSGKMALLIFRGGVEQGLLGRIGRHPFEFHGFGIISPSKKADSFHIMCCGVQGDFTKGLVHDAPKTIWTRQLRFAGLPYLSSLYRRGVCICTGSGVGAVLSTCLQCPTWYFIWIGSDLRNTFGDTLFELIEQYIEPERRIIWDTKLRGGRPDTMRLLEDTYRSWGAEMCIITSNPQGNKDMMEGCRERGLNAAGPLWDS